MKIKKKKELLTIILWYSPIAWNIQGSESNTK